MTEITLEFIGEQLRRQNEEMAAIRVDLRRLAVVAEGQQQILMRLQEGQRHLADDLTTMIRAEIGGQFANLETRLEQYIDRRLSEHSL